MPNPYKVGSIEYDNWNYEHPEEARDVVAEAEGSLGRANRLAAETGSARLAALPASLAALRQAADTRGPIRQITEPLASGGNAAMLAALPAGLINPIVGSALLTGGGLATLPDYFRKVVAPEGNESRPGIIESGMAGLAALPAGGAIRGLRALRAAAPLAEELAPEAAFVKDVVDTARGYRSEGQSMKQAAQRAGWPLGTSSEAFPYAEMPEQPYKPGELFPFQSEAIQERLNTPIKKLTREGAFRGDRTTGHFVEGKGGLQDLQAGKITRHPLPGPTYAAGNPEFVPVGEEAIYNASVTPPAAPIVDPQERLAARILERFRERHRGK